MGEVSVWLCCEGETAVASPRAWAAQRL